MKALYQSVTAENLRKSGREFRKMAMNHLIEAGLELQNLEHPRLELITATARWNAESSEGSSTGLNNETTNENVKLLAQKMPTFRKCAKLAILDSDRK